MLKGLKIYSSFRKNARAVVFPGDCLNLLKEIPEGAIQLIVTSPPYNIGKEYEKKLDLSAYIARQAPVIRECARVLSPRGSLCWQTGNYVNKGSIVPLDTALHPVFDSLGLKMRNRMIWHFGHGLHCSKRFSGRYETIVWLTKSDDYIFHLDPVRVPQKYPGKKYFKGPKSGQYSCNPLGKNPGDVWAIPNVKNNHVEKTSHPCQFPVELAERLILSMTDKDGWVLDPFLGSGTSLLAALKHGRRGAGAEISREYVNIAYERISQLKRGSLKCRPMSAPVYDPAKPNGGLRHKIKPKQRKTGF